MENFERGNSFFSQLLLFKDSFQRQLRIGFEIPYGMIQIEEYVLVSLIHVFPDTVQSVYHLQFLDEKRTPAYYRHRALAYRKSAENPLPLSAPLPFLYPQQQRQGDEHPLLSFLNTLP